MCAGSALHHKVNLGPPRWQYPSMGSAGRLPHVPLGEPSRQRLWATDTKKSAVVMGARKCRCLTTERAQYLGFGSLLRCTRTWSAVITRI
jgi:hypothetical protein